MNAPVGLREPKWWERPLARIGRPRFRTVTPENIVEYATEKAAVQAFAGSAWKCHCHTDIRVHSTVGNVQYGHKRLFWTPCRSGGHETAVYKRNCGSQGCSYWSLLYITNCT